MRLFWVITDLREPLLLGSSDVRGFVEEIMKEEGSI